MCGSSTIAGRQCSGEIVVRLVTHFSELHTWGARESSRTAAAEATDTEVARSRGH